MNGDTFVASIAHGQCPSCGAQDLHDGPRAAGKRLQNINIACFACRARFNLAMFGGDIIGGESTGRLAPGERDAFRPERFHDARVMAASTSYYRAHSTN